MGSYSRQRRGWQRQLLVLFGLALGAAFAGCSSEDGASAPSEPNWEAEADGLLSGTDWYRHAVFYEVFVRSFQDSDGDGIGDFKGLTSKLDYLKELGVDGIWLMPIMPTPFVDSGYDVADYRGINPDYGTMQDFEEFLAAAHSRKIRVLVDLVLNHTSDQHSWFTESRSSRDNPKADWYVWSDTPSSPDNGCGVHMSVFGDSAWEFDAGRGQYYFHRFYPGQPDLNYRSPEVVAETLDTARFWLDKGVDGFRCDVISLLHESADDCGFLDETKGYIRQLRGVVDEYPGAVLLAEPTDLGNSTEYFGNGSDMFHMTFNFGYGYFWRFQLGGGSAKSVRDVFQTTLDQYPAGAQDGLVIGSHDVLRAWSNAKENPVRYRQAALVQLTMKGSPFIYYGEELSLRPGTEEVVDNRDVARTPMPWSEAEPGHGFSSGEPWIAFGTDLEETNVAAQRATTGSMYSFYREVLGLRRGRAVWGNGALKLLTPSQPSLLAYLRSDSQLSYLVAVNLGPSGVKDSITLADLGGASSAALALGGGSLVITGETAEIELPADGYAIFELK